MIKKTKKMGKILSVLLFIIFTAFICSAITAHAEIIVLGTYGKTYPFAEKNFLTVIKNKAKKINWKKVIRNSHLKREVENFQPYNQEVALPEALHTKVFKPNMYYTLKFSIKNAKGQIIYPKGFRYKITNYITLPNILVVINGDNKKQVDWFRHSKYFNNISVMIMITKGNYYRLDKKFKIPVYYYMKQLQKRFRLKATPSVIWQKRHTIYVKQYGLGAIAEELHGFKKIKQIKTVSKKILKKLKLLP
jgi:conjugal transfer pilus assembly protein TraW